MEQILIRNLPPGTKAKLKERAVHNERSAEVEARQLLSDALDLTPATLVDLLTVTEGAEIEFEPERLNLSARTPAL